MSKKEGRMESEELLELARLLRKMGSEIESEPGEAHLPDMSDTDDIGSFYIPKAPKGFYDGCFARLRKAGKIGDLRGLTSVNSKVFRRLLGIKEC